MKKNILIFLMVMAVGCNSFYGLDYKEPKRQADAVGVDIGDVGLVDIIPQTDSALDMSMDTPAVKVTTRISGKVVSPENMKLEYSKIMVLLITDLSTVGAHVIQTTVPDQDLKFAFTNFPMGSYYIIAGHFQNNDLNMLADAIGAYGSIAKPKTIKITKTHPITKDIEVRLNPQQGTGGRFSIHGKVTIDDPSINPTDAAIFISDNPELGLSHWYMITILDPQGTFTVNGLSAGSYYVKTYALKNGDPKSPIGYGFYNDGIFPKAITLSDEIPAVTDANFRIYDYNQSPMVLSGKITNPQKGQNYVLFMKDPFPVPYESTMDFTSAKDDGSYMEVTLPKSKYYVYAYHFKDMASVCPDCYDSFGFYTKNGVFPTPVDLTSKSQLGIDITMHPFSKGNGVICGQVKADNLKDIRQYLRVFCTKDPSASRNSMPQVWANVDKTGHFCVKHLELDTPIYVHAVAFKDFDTMEVLAKGTYTGGTSIPKMISLNEYRQEFDGAVIDLKPVSTTPYGIKVHLNADPQLKPQNVYVCLSPVPFPDQDRCQVGVPDSSWNVSFENLPDSPVYIFAISDNSGKYFGFYPGTGLPEKMKPGKDIKIDVSIRKVPEGKCYIKGSIAGLPTDPPQTMGLYLYQNALSGLDTATPIWVDTVHTDQKFTVSNLKCGYYLPVAMTFLNGDTGLLPTIIAYPFADGLPTAVNANAGTCELDAGKVPHGPGTLTVSIDGLQSLPGSNVAVFLYSSLPEWGDPPYKVFSGPDASGDVGFTNLPLGDWYVYAFAYDGPMTGFDYKGLGFTSAGTIPVPVHLDASHRIVTTTIKLKSTTSGTAMITGHITNIGPALSYKDEVVFLCTTKVTGDPKTQAISATLVQDNGNYVFKHVPNGRYYLYSAHYGHGFSNAPDATGYYNTGAGPVSIVITAHSNALNKDIVIRR